MLDAISMGVSIASGISGFLVAEKNVELKEENNVQQND